MKKILFSLLLLTIIFYFLSCSKNSSDSPAEPTPQITKTFTITETPTLTYTHTVSPTITHTSTITNTNTFIPSFTITNTHTNSPTYTISPTFTNTSTPVTIQIKCVGTPSDCTNVYDVGIVENSTNNFGTSQVNSIGFDGAYKRRVLMKFDLSSIPTSAQIIEARLIFYVDNFSFAGSNPFYVGAYKINSDWEELTENWYTHNGGDFSTNVYLTAPITSTGSWTIFLIQSWVQEWVNNPASNYGILLKQEIENTTTDYIVISMKEHPDENCRPYLQVKYIY